MKRCKIYSFNKLAPSSFLAKKLRVSEAGQIHLPQGYELLNFAEILKENFQDVLVENKDALFDEAVQDLDSSDFVLLYNQNLISEKKHFEIYRKEFLKTIKGVQGTWIVRAEGLQRQGVSEFLNLPPLIDLNSLKAYPGLFSTLPRSFNNLEFTDRTVTKTSTWKEKALSEIQFFKNIPEVLKSYYLPVISVDQQKEKVSYSLPTSSYFDLSFLTIQDVLESADWQEFYHLMADYIELLPTHTVSKEEYQKSMMALFVDKLEERLTTFRSQDNYQNLCAQFSGQTGADFEAATKNLVLRLTDEIDKLSETKLHFSHGDLCFSNILYDLDERKMIFIDPRGVTNEKDQYRPLAYDLAKLSQCALGLYDFTLYDLEASDVQKAHLSESFLKFAAKSSLSYPFLRLCEASLLWSLLPLHAENNEHVLRFMLAGQSACVAGL